MQWHTPLRTARSRRGTAAVELAVALPVFLTFVFGLTEICRIRCVTNVLETACRMGARFGTADGVSSDEVRARVSHILSSTMRTNGVTIEVKDARVYDQDRPLPASEAELAALPSVELQDAEPRQLFLVRATVSYRDVALIPFRILNDVSFTGQAFMRHE